MWSPTHVVVAVKRANGLLTKGSHGTNDCFVTIGLGKEKYRTSIKEKSPPNCEWNEECELLIPEQGNKAEIVLTALHRNVLGVDEFLGTVRIPLSSFDVYERPKNRWYKLEAKKGKENKKERGELEVRIAFTVKAGSLTNLSKQEKHKSSLGGLSHLTQSVGGSLLSIGSIEKRKKGLKKFAKSIGSKVHITGKKKDKYTASDSESFTGSVGNMFGKVENVDNFLKAEKQHANVDPGVISEDEDEFTFDDLSQISSTSSVCSPNLSSGIHSLKSATTSERLNIIDPTKQTDPSETIVGSVEATSATNVTVDEWEAKLYGKNAISSKSSTLPIDIRPSSMVLSESPKLNATKDDVTLDLSPAPVQQQVSPKLTKFEEKKIEKPDKSSKFSKKFKYFRKEVNELEPEITKNAFKFEKKFDVKNVNERIIIGGENEMEHNENTIPNEILQRFDGKSRTDLIMMVMKLQSIVDDNKRKQKDLEDYLDELLLRVMETTPKILQRPYKRTSAK